MHNLLGRRYWAALLFAVLLLCASAGAASAHPNPGKGPHNENGNATLDVYTDEPFYGALGTAITNWNERNTSPTAPLIRKVSSIVKADVYVHYNRPGQTGAAHQHYDDRVDEIHISTESPNPPWVLTHELGHSHSMQDLTTEECAAIAPDPATGYKSIMCHARWEGGDITQHDAEDLYLIPNKRVTLAEVVTAPIKAKKFVTSARHKTH